MLQRYHLLLRDHRGRVLADSWPHGWLLPVIAADARERPSHVVSRFIERLNVEGSVVCVTSGIVDRQAAGIDWLAVVEVRSIACRIALRETAVDDLSERSALVSIQSDLLRAYRRLSETPQSALSPESLRRATTWATRFLPDGRDGIVKLIPHRSELFEAVLEFSRAPTSFFLKWRGQGSFLEAELAWILTRYGGGAHIPMTIAFDRTNGRWLTEGASGARLTADLSPAAIGRVAQAMAHAQMNVAPVILRLRSIGVLEESLADLASEGDQILDWLPCESDHQSVRARAAIHQACAELDALRLPATWIHTDFVPENVFINRNVVQFIDFDDPWIGPAPVVMEFLYGGLRRHIPDVTVRSAAVAAACESFVRAWRALIAPDVMRKAFASTRLVAEVLRISRRLRVVAAKEKNGELAGFMEPAARESARRLVSLANSDRARSPILSVSR